MSITAPDILDKAAGHMRDRARTYDSAKGERSMGKAVAMFNACHGTTLTEEQGWHLMELVKHVRYFTAPGYHADSVEDGAAYAALRGEAGAAKAYEPASEIDDESERQQLVQQSGEMAEHVYPAVDAAKDCGCHWRGKCNCHDCPRA